MLPMYIKYMGAEAYGLVGFFSMLQAWFNLLDLRLTPTIGRETARLPLAEEISKTALSLPMGPHLEPEDVREISRLVKESLKDLV